MFGKYYYLLLRNLSVSGTRSCEVVLLKEVSVHLFDLDPGSGIGTELRDILLSSRKPRVRVRQESIDENAIADSTENVPKTLARINPDIIFLVVPSKIIKQATPLIQILRQKPVITVVEGDHPAEAVELVKLGIADFITPPLKAVDVFPRLWRVLDLARQRSTFRYTAIC